MPITPPPVHLLPEVGALVKDRVTTDGSGGDYEHVYAATGRHPHNGGYGQPEDSE